MLERGYTDVDVVYTSMLKRSIRSSWALMKELDQIFRPVKKSWMLNQRMYGAFEGMAREDLKAEIGMDRIAEYRRSLFLKPPPMSEAHPRWHRDESKYRHVDREDIPLTESIWDCFQRVRPLYSSCILPDLISGKNVLVVAHDHSLRGIIRCIDHLSDQAALDIVIPNGSPLVFEFGADQRPIPNADSFLPTSGAFLENRRVLDMMISKEKQWGNNSAANEYKGMYSLIDYSTSSLMTPIMRGLSKLQEEREILENFHPGDQRGDSKTSVSRTSTDHGLEIPSSTGLETQSSFRFVNSTATASGRRSLIKEPYVVIVRHGQTEYNKLGIFTGWDDAPLAQEGQSGASRAGQLLKLHGIELDIVYTSWLSRAIETAWLILDELDQLWLPIVKSWRLNERMYGRLTGMSKRGIAERFGNQQFRAWRRGYAVQPPPVDSFDPNYPGNDERYVNYVTDLRISLFESVIRTLAKGKLQIHRKFPKTESLKDCMARTIPYFTDTIEPSIMQGKKVLIASSENAIRGLLMHLCDIPHERIHEISIPNSLPLVYNYRNKCIQVLDDGSDGSDPLEKYDFGESPELLFKPCDFANDADQCFLGEGGRSYSFDPVVRLVPVKDPLTAAAVPVIDPLTASHTVDPLTAVVVPVMQ